MASLELLRLTVEQKDDRRFYGIAMHTAHVVLGQLALLDGDINAAKEQLRLASEAPISELLGSRGPDMELARDLARLGEKECVQDFVDKVETTSGDSEKLDFDHWFEGAARGDSSPKIFTFDDSIGN